MLHAQLHPEGPSRRTIISSLHAFATQRLVGTNSDNGFGFLQCFEAFGSAMLSTPAYLLLDDMKHGNSIAKTANGTVSTT